MALDPAQVLEVDDAADPRLADYVGLSDRRRPRLEGERGCFVAESPLVVERLVRSGRPVRSVLLTPERLAALGRALDALGPAVPVYVAPLDVLRRVVGFDLHRGAVAAGDRWPLPSPGAVLGAARRVAVVERLADHENLGGVFRNAAAFGIDAVLLDPECADPLYRRCVRVSIGHVLTVPWTRVESLAVLRDRGFALLALTPAADAVPLGEVRWPARYALMLGAEGPGLSRAWLDAADVRVRIPMRAGADSVNVATAAAIAFYAGA